MNAKTKWDDLWNVLTRSEMWASMAIILGCIYEANVLPESWSKLLALVIAALAALGYGVNRTIRKNAADKNQAVLESTKVNP